MSNGAALNYDFPQKREWRRWQWNRIVERLKVPVKKAVVLYLAGAQDLDRVEAMKRGFLPENLIAVERDKRATGRLRTSGVNTICGDMCEIIAMWNEPKINVILADMCCGFGRQSAGFAGAIFTSMGISNQAVVSVNLQRGRDKVDAGLRAIAKEVMNPERSNEVKNRAGWFLLGLQQQAKYFSNLFFSNDFISTKLIVSSNLAMYSYKSDRGMFFDSVVFSFSGLNHLLKKDAGYQLETDKSILRRIAAAKAIRTMRSEL